MGEILAAHGGLVLGDHVALAEHALPDARGELRLALFDGGRVAARIADIGAAPQGLGNLGGDLAQPFSARSPGFPGRKLRTVPTSRTCSGITLKAPSWLVCMEQMLTTTESSGLTLRLAIVCSAEIPRAAAATGSTTSCGMAP